MEDYFYFGIVIKHLRQITITLLTFAPNLLKIKVFVLPPEFSALLQPCLWATCVLCETLASHSYY